MLICVIFLTDRELINTVMSRARYSIAVVGDPVVLCTFGSCRSIWQSYLEKCEELTGLYTNQYTVEKIQEEVFNFSVNEPAGKLLSLLSHYRQIQLG